MLALSHSLSQSSPPSTSPYLASSTSRVHTAADEALRTQLAELPTATPAEQAYASIAAKLLESVAYWRSRAESDRRKAELAIVQAQLAVQRVVAAAQSEGDTVLATLRAGGVMAGPNTGSPPSSASSSTALPHSAALHAQTHPSHLSRRVSFNRDVLIVAPAEVERRA